jgi:hypothetical protein
MPSPKPETGKPSATYQRAQKAKRAKPAKSLAGIRLIEPTPEIIRMMEERNGNGFGYRGALLPDQATLGTLASLARINATEREIASSLRVSDETFLAFKRQFPIVQQTLDANRGDGKVSLRRAQWQAAVEDRVPSMMIWLGKNELGQSDKAEVSHDVNVTVLRALMELGDD